VIRLKIGSVYGEDTVCICDSILIYKPAHFRIYPNIFMHSWFGIALVAYLIGAAIEGIITANQLSQSIPDLLKGTEEKPTESPESPGEVLQVFLVITAVSVGGAFFWPCRLLHRSIKEHHDDA
jgi:hypothetical protein